MIATRKFCTVIWFLLFAAGPLHTSTEETTVGNGTTEAMNEQETQNSKA